MGGHTADHLVPFQRRTWFRNTPPLAWCSPTDQQLAGDVQRILLVMLASPLAVPPGSGVATRDHFLPFQRSAWFRTAPVLPGTGPYRPTAQQLADELHASPDSVFSGLTRVPPGSGVATRDHFLPFQCSAWLRTGGDRPSTAPTGSPAVPRLPSESTLTFSGTRSSPPRSTSAWRCGTSKKPRLMPISRTTMRYDR